MKDIICGPLMILFGIGVFLFLMLIGDIHTIARELTLIEEKMK